MISIDGVGSQFWISGILLVCIIKTVKICCKIGAWSLFKLQWFQNFILGFSCHVKRKRTKGPWNEQAENGAFRKYKWNDCRNVFFDILDTKKRLHCFSILCTWVGFWKIGVVSVWFFQQLRWAYFCYDYSRTVCIFTWANNHTHRSSRAGKWSLGLQLFDKESKLGLLGDATWVSCHFYVYICCTYI